MFEWIGEKKYLFETLLGMIFWGFPYSIIFLHESFSWGLIRLHPKFHCPRPSGSALKVTVWGGGVEQSNTHYQPSLNCVELSWFELRVDKFLKNWSPQNSLKALRYLISQQNWRKMRKLPANVISFHRSLLVILIFDFLSNIII